MTDKAVIAFAKFLVRLKALDVSGCVKLTDASLRALHHYRSETLEEILAARTGMSDELARRWTQEARDALRMVSVSIVDD